VKAVPGRKTDIKDAAWLDDLLQHGLLRASIMPPVAQRELRDLTCYRSTFIQEWVTLVNRVQKLLEDANIKLAVVGSDMTGVSGRVILAVLPTGHADPQALADLAKGRLRSKRNQQASTVEGRVKPHPRPRMLTYEVVSSFRAVGPKCQEAVAYRRPPANRQRASGDRQPSPRPRRIKTIYA
jgi:transposase